MGQGFALVAEQQHEITGFGLGFAQLQAEADAIDGGGVLPALQRVPRPAPAELCLRSPSDSRDLEIVTPSRLSIAPIRRAKVQFGRSATDASSNGSATRSATAALTAAGPGATLAVNAATPPRAKSLRHRRDGILPHAEGFRDPRAGPAGQRQQHRTRPIRLAPIARVAESHELTPLRGARDNRGFARHDPPPEPNQEMESQTASVGHSAETC